MKGWMCWVVAFLEWMTLALLLSLNWLTALRQYLDHHSASGWHGQTISSLPTPWMTVSAALHLFIPASIITRAQSPPGPHTHGLPEPVTIWIDHRFRLTVNSKQHVAWHRNLSPSRPIS